MKKLIFLVLSFFSVAFVYGQETVVINSENLKTNDSIWVYKPAAYTVEKQYPAVILLHGHNANYRSWSRLADLQKLADQYDFVVICPDGLVKSWYINSPGKEGWQYESFFMKEFLPLMFRKYSLDKKKLFITGASMGGYGALWLFIRHPDVFLSAGSTSGVVDLRYSAFKKTTLAALLGEYSETNKAFDDYSVINHLKDIQGLNKQIIFDCGTEDYHYIPNKKFREKCDELKIKATYIAQPGAHTGGYWSHSILEHFRFFAELAYKK